ncbi:MAG TPA: DUF885 domain-containing protein [Candidatus Binataceae bacterium]
MARLRAMRHVKHQLVLPALVFLFAACAMTLASFAADSPTPRPSAQPAAADDSAFRVQVSKFIESEMRMFPQHATGIGDHRFDNRMNDLSASGIAAEIAHAYEWQKTFSAYNPQSLSPDNEADREWLLAHLDSELLSTRQIRDYERDPGMYLPTAAVYSLVQRSFAPPEVRIALVTAREKASLANLEAARKNLEPARTPKVAIDIVLDQMAGTLNFFRTELPAAFAPVPDTAPEKQEFARANAVTIAAIEKYRDWLSSDLRAHAAGDYAIGAQAYREMLADSDMVDIPLAQLERVGEKELARLQNELRKTAAEIDPKHSPAEVAAALSREHPARDQVLPAVTAGLSEIRSYVVTHHLATIPSEVPPLVRETPPFMRATTFASMDTPGPLEKAPEAYFYVTLPDPSWPPERTEQLLQFFSGPAISDTSVHEVYPGHYVQFLNNRLNPDLVRSIFHSGANAEGWALYCEQMMLDEGLHRGDPKYRLAQLQMALLRACRYLVGLRMHTGGMTVEQAAAFFQQNSYVSPHNAMVEALRGTEDPGYLRYQLGKLMILKLREDVRRKQGSAFDIGKFHDAFLRQGAMPIKLIRRAMLDSDGPLLQP